MIVQVKVGYDMVPPSRSGVSWDHTEALSKASRRPADREQAPLFTSNKIGKHMTLQVDPQIMV